MSSSAPTRRSQSTLTTAPGYRLVLLSLFLKRAMSWFSSLANFKLKKYHSRLVRIRVGFRDHRVRLQ